MILAVDYTYNYVLHVPRIMFIWGKDFPTSPGTPPHDKDNENKLQSNSLDY